MPVSRSVRIATPEVFLAFRETQSIRRVFVGIFEKCVLSDLWLRTGYSGHKWYVEHTLVKSFDTFGAKCCSFW